MVCCSEKSYCKFEWLVRGWKWLGLSQLPAPVFEKVVLRNFHEWSNAIPSFFKQRALTSALVARAGCLWNNERVSNYGFSKGNGNAYYFVEQGICIYIYIYTSRIKILGQVLTKRIQKKPVFESRCCAPRCWTGNSISDRYIENRME